MADPNAVLIALEKIQAQRHGSFAIVTADAHKNYYAQLVAGGETGLYGEVVDRRERRRTEEAIDGAALDVCEQPDRVGRVRLPVEEYVEHDVRVE